MTCQPGLLIKARLVLEEEEAQKGGTEGEQIET